MCHRLLLYGNGNVYAMEKLWWMICRADRRTPSEAIPHTPYWRIFLLQYTHKTNTYALRLYFVVKAHCAKFRISTHLVFYQNVWNLYRCVCADKGTNCMFVCELCHVCSAIHVIQTFGRRLTQQKPFGRMCTDTDLTHIQKHSQQEEKSTQGCHKIISKWTFSRKNADDDPKMW